MSTLVAVGFGLAWIGLLVLCFVAVSKALADWWKQRVSPKGGA
jgi:hypothetical protein